MFLTIHASAGLLIGSQTGNPWLAFIFGWFSHWLLDAIPHGDEMLADDNLSAQNQTKRFFWVAAVDTLGVIGIFTAATSFNLLTYDAALLSGMLGAVSPDYLWGTERVLGHRLLPWLQKIHSSFHHLFKQQVPLHLGLVNQLAMLIGCWLLILGLN